VSPVKYELGLYIPEDILHSHRRKHLKSYRLGVVENRVLRRIFVPQWDAVTGGWRKLHNEELHNLYSSASIIRIIKSRYVR
jgi:hypothetical protein